MRLVVSCQLLVVSIFLAAGICLFNPSGLAEETKGPNVAGSFYPASPQKLSFMIDGYMAAVPEQDIPGIIALISPHAGYEYSGPVAAYGYKAIQGKNYKTVIILAPSHYVGFAGISVWPQGKFRTPLGDIPVDSQLAGQLIEEGKDIGFLLQAFQKEHSLEVQLPFLQKTLKDFKIVAVIMGQPDYEACQNFAAILAKVVGNRDDVLIVASTDLSHFHPQKEAQAIDAKTMAYLQRFDTRGLWESSSKYDPSMCGLVPVVTTLLYCQERGYQDIKILKHATSADVTGDLNRVVGYLSAVIYRAEEPKGASAMLNTEQRKRLLEIARQSLENYLQTGKRRQFSVSDPALTREQGAFVTLTENGELRGCIGRIVGDMPLYKAVAEMAIQAGTGDPRFPPVEPEEFKKLEFEISVLSPLEKVGDINQIKVGTHGIIIRKGFNSGLLLPQVATEYGWDRQTFLEQTCRKAGLLPHAWKQGAEIYIFSAEVFSEKSL